MSGEHVIDLLVIGLGPAGASAAWAAAERGLKVLAVDRRAKPGEPVQCAEFVPEAFANAAAVASTCQTIAAMRTYVEDDPPDVTGGFNGRMIDRARFDAHLVGDAQAAGVQTAFGSSVSALTEDGVVVLSDGTRLAARAIIGADGPRSVVGRTIDCSNTAFVETRQITVPLLHPQDSTDIFLSGEIPGGYGWLFPKNDRANLGLGVASEARARLKPLLTDLHQVLIARGLVGENIFATTGGAIPVSGMNAATGMLGDCLVLLAGDAAGLTNPITGAGIPAAAISGWLAGEAAADWIAGDAEAADDYRQQIDDHFGVALRRALNRRQRLIERGADVQKDDLRGAWIAYPAYWEALVS